MVMAVIAIFSLIQPTVNADPRPAQSSPIQPNRTPAQTETDAMRQARSTGRPVEIGEQTSETTQVLANPDGSFTMRSNVRAVRAKRDGAWRGIDTTLARNPDGTLAPVATAQDVTFSGGGTGPLITLRHAGKALSLAWPGGLPAPTVDGDTAVYRGVLPGVDLQITAQADSYSQVLVVHDAAAAANPALRQIRLTVTGTGVNVAATPDGRLSATDADGTEIFHAPAPLMWDSRHDDPLAPPPTATEPGSGRISRIAVSASARTTARDATATSIAELALMPEPAALTGPGVTYPVYIDPTFAHRKQHWTEVTDSGWHYFDANKLAQVGYCGGWDGCDGYWRARSYFQFDISPLWPRNGRYPAIWRAQLFANQVWAADHNCQGGQPTEVVESGGIDPGTRWPGPAGLWLDTQFSNAGGPCPAANLVFNVWTGVRHASDGSWANLVLGLKAPDENNRLQWKKFDNNPLLEVDYSFPPNPATALRVSNEIRCDGKVITPDAQPVLYSTATDNNNPPLQLGLAHEVWNSAHTAKLTNTPSPSPDVISSGATGQWRISRIGDGNFAFRTAVYNIYPGDSAKNLWNGGWSGWYPFSIDATPPVTAPTTTNADYPPEYWGAPSGAPGAVAVSTTVADVVGFTYTFAGSGTAVVPNSTDCNYHRRFGTTGGWIPRSDTGPDWIPIPAGLAPGRHTLYVRSFDAAHNVSAESVPYTFYVAPHTGLSTQRFEAETMTRTQPLGQNVRLEPVNDCCNISWSGGAELAFWGNAAGQSYSLSFQTTVESTYRIAIGLTKNTSQGRLTFHLDGQPIGSQTPGKPPGEIDAFNTRMLSAHHPLGNRHLTPGPHTFTVTVTGTNPASVSPRYAASIDYLDLTQTTHYEAEDSAQITRSQPDGQNISLGPQTNCCSNVPWSNGAQLAFLANRPNTSFDLAFRVPVEADYALGAHLTKASDYGKVTFLLDGRPLIDGDTWDGYRATGMASEYVPLGGAHLTVGQHRLTIKVVGTNPASVNLRYVAGIDYLSVVAVNNVTAANFTAAMNNDGIGSDNTTAANLDLNGASLSAQALAAAGYAPGATATINGATFTMPAARSDGMDNVIALGQTIPFPLAQQVRASAVGLLVAPVSTTCGGTPYAGTATITYTDNTTQDSAVRFGDDWSRPGANFDVVLPYRNEGTTPNRTVAAKLSAVFAPANPAKTLKSITLPNFGSNLLPGGCAAAQHVFAIAPRPARPGWIGAWAAPADTAVPPDGGVGFANQTLRTVVHPTVTGNEVRIRLDNYGSGAPVTFGAATLAAQSGSAAATLAAPTALTFGGNAQITIPAGAEALSDPVPFPTTAGGSGNLVVSLHVSAAVTSAAVHAYPTTPTFLATGNTTADATGSPFTTRVAGIRFLSDVEVSTLDPTHGTVAVLGDQLTAIGAPGDGHRPTWVDALPAKLATAGVPLPGGLVNASQAGLQPAGHWRLDDGTGTTARDSAGSANATLTGGVTWSGDRGGSVLLDGSSGCLVTTGRVLATNASFTVSAWVKLNPTGSGPQTVVSQDGTNSNAFALQYTGTPDDKWAFTLPATSANGATAVRVLSQEPVQRGVWTHLVGSYDAPNKLATLYVNGHRQDDAIHSTPWPSAGPLAIGRGKANGGPTVFLNGAVSDVRTYQRPINEYDVFVLQHGSPVPGDQPGIGATRASSPADDTLNRTVLNQPNLRTVIVALGSNELLGDFSAEVIRIYLRGTLLDIRTNRRTDGTPVHVIAVTVPPLGLADTDPREQQRQQFNADLIANYTDFGADDVVDIAAAVRDPARPHQINPAYLTNGVPNAAYHEAIAQAIADAASRFPPEARL
jgi:hypothetical protein